MRYAIRGKHLVIDWTPSGGEKLHVFLSPQVPESTSWHDPMFLGRSEVSDNCFDVVKDRFAAFLCGQMILFEKDPTGKYAREEKKRESRDEKNLIKARRNAALAKSGTQVRIRAVWPFNA